MAYTDRSHLQPLHLAIQVEESLLQVRIPQLLMGSLLVCLELCPTPIPRYIMVSTSSTWVNIKVELVTIMLMANSVA